MRNLTTLILLCVFASLAAGCSRASAQSPSPTPTWTTQANVTQTNVTPRAPISALSTPTPTPAAALSPLEVPVIPEPTPFVSHPEMHSPAFGQITGTPVPAASLVLCTPQDEMVDCYDSLLEMQFSYPTYMGKIEYTTLRRGGYAGFAYDYALSEREGAMGGRSHDFSEGRGPMGTDQMGFDGRDAADICAGWVAAMCQELAPNLIHMVILPQTEWLCGGSMMFQPYPVSILALDLPDHPLINGFAFSTALLSPVAEAEFAAQWYEPEDACSPEHVAEMAEAMEQLALDLEAGDADDEIQARYDAMLQLAESIQGPYMDVTP